MHILSKIQNCVKFLKFHRKSSNPSKIVTSPRPPSTETPCEPHARAVSRSWTTNRVPRTIYSSRRIDLEVTHKLILSLYSSILSTKMYILSKIQNFIKFLENPSKIHQIHQKSSPHPHPHPPRRLASNIHELFRGVGRQTRYLGLSTRPGELI